MEKQPINTVYVITKSVYDIKTGRYTKCIDTVRWREDEAIKYCNKLNNNQYTKDIHRFWKYEEVKIQ